MLWKFQTITELLGLWVALAVAVVLRAGLEPQTARDHRPPEPTLAIDSSDQEALAKVFEDLAIKHDNFDQEKQIEASRAADPDPESKEVKSEPTPTEDRQPNDRNPTAVPLLPALFTTAAANGEPWTEGGPDVYYRILSVHPDHVWAIYSQKGMLNLFDQYDPLTGRTTVTTELPDPARFIRITFKNGYRAGLPFDKGVLFLTASAGVQAERLSAQHRHIEISATGLRGLPDE